MDQYLKTNEAAVNYNGAMESRDHFKNGFKKTVSEIYFVSLKKKW